MPDISPLIHSLERRDVLCSEDRRMLAALQLRTKHFASGNDIIRQGSEPTESCLIVSGFAARCQYMSDGGRQLTAMHVPGDFVDLHGLLLKIMDHSVVAIGPCEAAFVPHQQLERITGASPHLTRLLWLLTVIDGSIQRAWLTSLGRRTAEQQLAHLVCELYIRLEAVDLPANFSFDVPATQKDISDMLGLSTVHMNRTIQALRKTELLTWHGATVTINDFEKLSALAEFDPAYLNLCSKPR